jgi:acyl-CoA reductase-like NAD-dependent aldehyde dehydrogenase
MTLPDYQKSIGLYIDGEWLDAETADGLEVLNPATEEVIGILLRASTILIFSSLE